MLLSLSAFDFRSQRIFVCVRFEPECERKCDGVRSEQMAVLLKTLRRTMSHRVSIDNNSNANWNAFFRHRFRAILQAIYVQKFCAEHRAKRAAAIKRFLSEPSCVPSFFWRQPSWFEQFFPT